MTRPTTAQDFGIDAWLRPFREAMSALHTAPFAGGFPGASPSAYAAPWSSPGAWFSGPAAGAAPGWAQAFSGAPAQGAFMNLFEQLSGLAQAQWQQLVAQAGAGEMGGNDALAHWRTLLGSVGARLASAAGPFELGPLPAMDTAALRESLSTPPVGPMREHIERWQQAMLAQLDYQDAAREFSAQLGETMKLAHSHLQARLAARAERNEPLASSRALFDEWIEAGEQAWAERAGSDAFVAALGRYTNAEMKLRAALSDQLNRVVGSLGLPTRGEVDADHRRIAQLERELRRLRAEVQTLRAGDQTGASHAPRAQSPRPSTPRPAAAAPVASDPPAAAAGARSARRAAAPAKAAPPRARRPAAKAPAPAPKRAKATVTMLPLVDAPRALGQRGTSRTDTVTRRRAGK